MGGVFFLNKKTDTLPETNSSPLKMDGWNTTFLLGRPIFRGYVSFREDIRCKPNKKNRCKANLSGFLLGDFKSLTTFV